MHLYSRRYIEKMWVEWIEYVAYLLQCGKHILFYLNFQNVLQSWWSNRDMINKSVDVIANLSETSSETTMNFSSLVEDIWFLSFPSILYMRFHLGMKQH